MRRLIVLLTLLVVAAALIPSPPSPVTLVVYISPDAWSERDDRLANDAIAEFNATHPISFGDREIEIAPTSIASGEAEKTLAGATSTASVWIPASAMWGDLLNLERPAGWARRDAPDLVHSPQVLAMWASDLERMGPHASGTMGWREILRFARERGAWGAAVGDPGERFQLLHANPRISTSGVSAAIAEFATASGERSDQLTSDVVAGSRDAIHQIEGSIVHYGDIARDLMKQLACHGESYASTVYVQEQSVGEFNDVAFDDEAGCVRQPHHSALVPIIPSEGTFVADYPCYALDRLDLGSAPIDAAEDFCTWLAAWFKDHPDRVSRFHFRPATYEPNRTLAAPGADVIRSVQQVWREERKPASVMITIDTSQSMGLDKLDQVSAKVAECLGDSLTEDDRVGMRSANGIDVEKVPLAPLTPQHEGRIIATMHSLLAEGGDALRDAISASVDAVRTDYDAARINAVVVLSDGIEQPDNSDTAQRDLLRKVKQRPSVRVFIVTLESATDTSSFANIADASLGRVIPETTAGGDICQAAFDYF